MAQPAKFDFRIDATRFNSMLRELAAVFPATEWDDILTGEVAAVAYAAQRGTRSASVKKIRQDVAGRQWVTITGKKYKLSHRYPTGLWRKIEADLRRGLDTKLAARGLARRSWLAAFPALGRESPGAIPAYVQRANAKGQQFINTFITRENRGDQSGIRLENRAPGVDWPAARMRSALLRAINGRVGFFTRNMETGFYRTLKERAAKYPGIAVSR